jgi:hypothetical protein
MSAVSRVQWDRKIADRGKQTSGLGILVDPHDDHFDAQTFGVRLFGGGGQTH